MSLLISETEALVETVYAAAGVNELLSAGEKRMTFGADIETDVILGGSGLIFRTASTLYGNCFVLGMNSFLHYCHPFLS